MLKELGIQLDEPKTPTEVLLRKTYLSYIGREPDLAGLSYWANLIDEGKITLNDVITSNQNERNQYIAQANGNPVVNLIRRDNDGIIEAYEAAFNTQYDRKDYFHYTSTNDIISLPYEHRIYIQNKLASGNVNINPYGIASFIGSMVLDPPDNSLQFSNKSVPGITNNDTVDNYTSIVNNFKTTLQNQENVVVLSDSQSGFYGSYYGAWELLSQGTPVLNTSTNKVTRVDDYGKFKFDFNIKPVTSVSRSARADIRFDENLRPKMSDITIGFSVQGMKPNTRVYAFFGDREVSGACEVFVQLGGGQDIRTTNLVTDSRGTIRGTFKYSEKDLNFDSGVYVFALSDDPNNGNNRTTYAAMPFDGGGLVGYGDEKYTRTAVVQVNKTSYQVAADSRNAIVSDGPTAASAIDVIDFCFIYGLGRKPSSSEKEAIYDKWQAAGVESITTWNAIVNIDPKTNANTDGTELWHPWAWPVVDPILTYVDRSTAVVANGTDSADLRSKYLAAVTYPYGRWNWWYLPDEPTFPATINYSQFMDTTDPTAGLVPPWYTDLSANTSFNAEGLKVFNILRRFTNDVNSITNLGPNDLQGALGYASRLYSFVGYDTAGNPQPLNPGMPKTYKAIKYPAEYATNTHTITTVWDSVLSDDCSQPYRVIHVGSRTSTANLYAVINGSSRLRDGFAASPFTVNPSNGTILGSKGRWGKGPWISVDQTLTPPNYAADINWFLNGVDFRDPGNEYQVGAKGYGDFWRNWASTPSSVYISGTNYMLLGLHYGDYDNKIVIGIKSGSNGSASATPITIVVNGTNSYKTYIPATSGSTWEISGTYSNAIDVYYPQGGKEYSDPLGLLPLIESGQDFTFEIYVGTHYIPPTPTGVQDQQSGYVLDGSSSSDVIESGGADGW